jgi:hypothetical protein
MEEKDSCEQSYEARITKIKLESKELTSQYKKEMEGVWRVCITASHSVLSHRKGGVRCWCSVRHSPWRTLAKFLAYSFCAMSHDKSCMWHSAAILY